MNDAINDKPYTTEITDASPELNLELDEQELVDFIEAYSKKSKKYYEEKHIDKKRKTNRRFFMGRQVNAETEEYRGIGFKRAIKSYEKPYLDNIIKEGHDAIRPIILSRLPDIVVNKGTSQGQMSEEVARLLSEAISKTLTSQELREVLTMAVRHHATDYIGCIKYRWDPSEGRNGDVVFEVIHPDNILLDSSATKADESDMKVIIHYVTKPIKDWIQLFPSKKEEILKYAKGKGFLNNKKEQQALAVDLKLEEVWFDWTEDEEDETGELVYKRMSGVLWKMGKKILDKKKNPNWDWEGKQTLLFNGQPIPDELMGQIAMLGNSIPGIEVKQTFRNFFNEPKKPFIFLAFEQYGKMPLDETNKVEENLLLQQNYDLRGMQITKMIDDARGKHIFSDLSGLKRSTVEEMDLDNPDEDLYVSGDLRQVHAFIAKEQPSGQMFEDLSRSRERILSKMNVHGATRGEVVTSTATTNQISREADYTVLDELAEFLVTKPSMQISQALLHMIKLRYTPEHFMALIGDKGDELYQKITADIIEDGLEVVITASTTDKLRAERQAKEEAQLGLIDPLNYFRDTGRDDPEKRAEMLFMFQSQPELYFSKFVRGEDVQQIAAGVQQGNQQAMAQQSAPQQGGAPMQPSPQDTSNVATTPQGSPRGLMGRAGQAVSQLFNR